MAGKKSKADIETLNEISAAIDKHIKANNMSLSEYAIKAGVAYATVNRLYNKKSSPSIKTVNAVLKPTKKRLRL